MIRLLFISHTGNNEPPMAQYIMDHLIQKAGLTDALSVSAASFAKEGAPFPRRRRRRSLPTASPIR